jgi:hypothetical protein
MQQFLQHRLRQVQQLCDVVRVTIVVACQLPLQRVHGLVQHSRCVGRCRYDGLQPRVGVGGAREVVGRQSVHGCQRAFQVRVAACALQNPNGSGQPLRALLLQRSDLCTGVGVESNVSM